MRKENDILAATRKVFGKLEGEPRSLEQRLQSLTEQESGLVVQTAHFVKTAHSFWDLKPSKPKEPYIDFTRKMYPKLSFHLQQIIADILDVAEPVEEQPKQNKRDRIIKGVQDSYSKSGEQKIKMNFSQRVSSDEEKAEQLKEKIMESLKLNDLPISKS